MKDTKENTKKDTKEEFCGACVTIPLAFAGAGATVYGSRGRGYYQKKKRFIFWIGIGTVLLSLLIIIYYVRTCSECS